MARPESDAHGRKHRSFEIDISEGQEIDMSIDQRPVSDSSDPGSHTFEQVAIDSAASLFSSINVIAMQRLRDKEEEV